MQSLKGVIGIAIFLTCSIAHSATQLAAQKIERIDTGWSNEGIYIFTVEQLEAEGCSKTGVVIQNDHPYFDEVLSIALSALHGGKNVRLRVIGCASNGYMILNAIQIQA